MTWTRATFSSALALVLTATGCGPSHAEVAQTTLVALPPAMSAALVAAFALRRVWGDEVSFPKLGSATIVAGVVVALALAQSHHFDVELLGPVLMITVPSTTGLSLVFARMRLAAPAERSIVLVPLLVACLFALPFVSLLLVGADAEPCFTVGVIAIVGGFYLFPVVLLGLVIERVIRARRAARPHDGEGAP